MSNILSAVENSESEPTEKVPRTEVTGYWSQLKAGFTLEKHADVLQLRNVVLTITTVFDQLRPVFQVFFAGVRLVEFLQLAEHHAPILIV